ncbi:MAG: ATP-binding protein [Planctomycetota bacterium]|nr:MAG: ATP-binding protein [Planctomycetota bacterium]
MNSQKFPHRSRKLRPTELRWNCPAGWVRQATKAADGEDPLPDLIGQERALEALEMGLAVNAPGYNVFVTGLGGEATTGVVGRILAQLPAQNRRLKDHVFVHHFSDPIRPKHLALPPGEGRRFRELALDWRRALRREIPRLLEGKEHQQRQQALMQRYREAEDKLFHRLSKQIRHRGLRLVQVETDEGSHPDIYFNVDSEPVAPEAMGSLPKEKRPPVAKLKAWIRTREEMLTQLRAAQRKSQALGLRLLRESRSLDENRVREAVEDLRQHVAEELQAEGSLAEWLQAGEKFVLANLDLFRRGTAGREEDEDDGLESEGRQRRPGLEVFEVNVVRTVNGEPSPQVLELHPNYSNLFGTVERRQLNSGPGYYHLSVRPGSLLTADGGTLVLNARDVLKEAEVWRALKRSLQNYRLEVHALDSVSPLGVTGIRPEAISLDVKVVMIGDNALYESLHDSDFDFSRIFKVKAEFDDTLPVNQDFVRRLVRVLRDLGQREALLPFAAGGLQALVERAVRGSGRRNRLTAQLTTLADFAREASYFARKAGKARIDREAVEESRRNFRRQHSLDAEWHYRMVLEEVFQIATEGEKVGTVNGLTVISMGPVNFGRCSPISASVSIGDDSYLSVEREVDLSGPIHTMGVIMLEAFMRARFGQSRTLPIKVVLNFDQSYGPVDGDSASSSEVFALLSAISGVPLKQNVAVTGAVNMRGRILAVGGVNQKIEGFYHLCNQRGLTGNQGVLVPAANLGDLMVDPEVVAAVRQGLFHIWVMENVEQGLQLMSGLKAGVADRAGHYPVDSFFGKVEKSLAAYEQALKGDDRQSGGESEGQETKKGRKKAAGDRESS